MHVPWWFLWIGFCVLNLLSTLSDFLSREKLTQKWLEPKAEQFTKFKSWMINWPKYQFSSGYFGISFSREKKSERIERKFKTQNQNLWHLGIWLLKLGCGHGKWRDFHLDHPSSLAQLICSPFARLEHKPENKWGN